ncbi:MAG: hypothetical protein HC894_06255 [Microcoleus sp. SM1_3_4]|nr:hypothetical protein [Microcoleus sp. SM1_3_4]
MFDSDADLLKALETGATLGSEDLEGFDDLLDSIDAGALVTSELATGSWETDDEQAESESSPLENMELSDFFDSQEESAAGAGGDFDDLEAMLVAGGASASAASSRGQLRLL